MPALPSGNSSQIASRTIPLVCESGDWWMGRGAQALGSAIARRWGLPRDTLIGFMDRAGQSVAHRPQKQLSVNSVG
ncbi:hypothetical protein VTN49DRAFT_4307 [Thermomyces lanuginosus]|uniref:uncharacterized protein n=1 Tax=Thermomyces lanuginosus TaxID=5541 RepID=UPI0037449271